MLQFKNDSSSPHTFFPYVICQERRRSQVTTQKALSLSDFKIVFAKITCLTRMATKAVNLSLLLVPVSSGDESGRAMSDSRLSAVVEWWCFMLRLEWWSLAPLCSIILWYSESAVSRRMLQNQKQRLEEMQCISANRASSWCRFMMT